MSRLKLDQLVHLYRLGQQASHISGGAAEAAESENTVAEATVSQRTN